MAELVSLLAIGEQSGGGQIKGLLANLCGSCSGVCLLLLSLLGAGCQANEATSTFPTITGDYFGEEPPGAEPVLFAPGIASTDMGDDWPPIFTPDGNEALLRVAGPAEDERIHVKLVHSQRVAGTWQAPVPLWFSNQFLVVEGFFALSPDGTKLFVSTRRSEWQEDSPPDRDIWIFEREGDEWGEPVSTGPLVNSDVHDLVSSVASDGTIYFDREPREGDWYAESYFARPDGSGGYLEAEELVISGTQSFLKACIAHDDSYLILTGSNPGRGFDLFVSFKTADDSWGEPINIEAINSEYSDKFPGLSPDGKYLFFASRRTQAEDTPTRLWGQSELGILPSTPGNQVDVYWVSTSVIEDLRPR